MSASENYYSDTQWLDLEPQPLITTRFSESWSMGDALIDYATARGLFEQYVCMIRVAKLESPYADFH